MAQGLGIIYKRMGLTSNTIMWYMVHFWGCVKVCYSDLVLQGDLNWFGEFRRSGAE